MIRPLEVLNPDLENASDIREEVDLTAEALRNISLDDLSELMGGRHPPGVRTAKESSATLVVDDQGRSFIPDANGNHVRVIFDSRVSPWLP